MPDDQNPKTTTIDDLVKELSKNSNSSQPLPANQNEPMANQGPPSNLPGIKIGSSLPASSVDQSQQTPSGFEPPKSPLAGSGLPQFDLPRPPASLPPTNTIKPPISMPPKPVFSTPLKPSSENLSDIPPVKSPGVKKDISSTSVNIPKPSLFQEYKSSIRTMGEDIASLKSGQKPSSVDTPRKIGPEPRSVLEEMPTKLPVSPQPRTEPGFSIGLGKAEKTEPLPAPPPLPSLQKPITKTSEIQPIITVPYKKKSFSVKFYLFLAGVLVLGGFLYWFLILRVTEPEVVITPTPTPTPTFTPQKRGLNEIFENNRVNFEVLSDRNNKNNFKMFVDDLNIALNDFLKINLIENVDDILAPLGFLDLFDRDLTAYPANLKDNLIDSTMLVYGQSELFKEDGSINLSSQGLKKPVFVAEIKDEITVETLMNEWEATIAGDLSDYLFINNTAKEASTSFLDNTYRGISVRYKNFPFPDTTIDYAVINLAGQNYLIIAGSRESIYSTIDVLID